MMDEFFFFTIGFVSAWFLFGAVFLCIKLFAKRPYDYENGLFAGALSAIAIIPAILIAVVIREYRIVQHYIKRRRLEKASRYKVYGR